MIHQFRIEFRGFVNSYICLMKCQYCNHHCHKKGFQQNGTQKYCCTVCRKYQQSVYKKKAYRTNLNNKIIVLLKEGCGIRSIARILKIATNTVIKRIRQIAKGIIKPKVSFHKKYEVDEIRTFVRKKQNQFWIAYAIDKDNNVVDYRVGKRTKKTLQGLIETLLLAKAKKISTDGLDIYNSLIPRKQHTVKQHGINHIERKNLSLRTHLKRLNRRTICFSKKADMLDACFRIYCWG